MASRSKLEEGSVKIGEYEFHPFDIIGRGATGDVLRGYRVAGKERVAVKAIDMGKVTNEVTRYLLDSEKTAMRTIKNPFVIRTEQIFQEEEYCFIVMEMCTRGTLKDYIQSKGKLEQTEALELFNKILVGYLAIIDARIIHRDLKTANIMLRSNYDPAIIDFGFCELIMGKRPLIKYNVGSPTYMAPEAKLKCSFSEKSDVWALGIILHEMLTGKGLDAGKQEDLYFQQIKNRKMALYNQSLFSDLVNEVFEQTFKTDPQERASAAKIKYIIDKAMLGKLPLLDLHGNIIESAPQGERQNVQKKVNSQENMVESSKNLNPQRKIRFNSTNNSTKSPLRFSQPSSVRQSVQNSTFNWENADSSFSGEPKQRSYFNPAQLSFGGSSNLNFSKKAASDRCNFVPKTQQLHKPPVHLRQSYGVPITTKSPNFSHNTHKNQSASSIKWTITSPIKPLNNNKQTIFKSAKYNRSSFRNGKSVMNQEQLSDRSFEKSPNACGPISSIRGVVTQPKQIKWGY